MTDNVKEWFVPRYQTEVKHAYQQMDQRLGATVAGGGSFIGDKAYFPRMGAVDVYDSPEFSRLILANVKQDFIELSASPKFVAFGLWDPHRHKYQIATAVEYGKAGAAAIARGEDQCIIDALADAAANGVKQIGAKNGEVDQITTLGDYDTVADLDLIAEAIAILGGREAFMGESVTCLTPFRQKMQFALDPYMASNDVKANMPWNDLNWRRSERLPQSSNGEGVDLFMYAKSAIVSGYNPTEIDERDGPALTDIFGQWFQAAAKVRDAGGVIRIRSKKNFSLYRQPTPVEGLVAAAA
jgi:hypothetical protein